MLVERNNLRGLTGITVSNTCNLSALLRALQNGVLRNTSGELVKAYLIFQASP
jgi:hypothetical protein